MQHLIFRLSVCDEAGCLAGYIDTPDPVAGSEVPLGHREFIILSRSKTDWKYEPGLSRCRRLKLAATNTLEVLLRIPGHRIHTAGAFSH
jgi:hypothetical protein